MRIFSTILITVFFTCLSWAQTVFINEIVNDGPVGSRGVELAGPSGLTLTSWTLELHDDNGNVYQTVDLSGVSFQPAAGNVDQVWFPIAQLRSISEGGCGVALIDDLTNPLQFISYCKVIVAVNGAAIGLTSQLISILNPILGQSHQLFGIGKLLTAFTWTIGVSSPGSLNDNQSFVINLPLEMVDFEAKVVGFDIQVAWSTSYEENLSNFRLEHSDDGIGFERVSTIAANNDGGQLTQYNYRHKNLPAGIHYYRIIGIDVDGQEAMTSGTIAAKMSSDDIYANPNPATDHITVQLPKGRDEAIVDVFDITGKLVISTTITDGGQLDVSNFLPGKYILQINDGKNLKVIPILKK